MERTRDVKFVPLLAAVMVLIAGCARPPFPDPVMAQVDRSISFADIVNSPESHKGKWVMLAGVIVSSSTEKDGSTSIEVVQKAADGEGRPLETDVTGGRFIAVSKQFLDPAVYQGGRSITVVGAVIGTVVKPLGEISYRYPLLQVEAVHLWPPYAVPTSSFGVGVGVFHGY
jgi:outer membrane lipoprotein